MAFQLQVLISWNVNAKRELYRILAARMENGRQKVVECILRCQRAAAALHIPNLTVFGSAVYCSHPNDLDLALDDHFITDSLASSLAKACGIPIDLHSITSLERSFLAFKLIVNHTMTDTNFLLHLPDENVRSEIAVLGEETIYLLDSIASAQQTKQSGVNRIVLPAFVAAYEMLERIFKLIVGPSWVPKPEEEEGGYHRQLLNEVENHYTGTTKEFENFLVLRNNSTYVHIPVLSIQNVTNTKYVRHID